MQPVEEEILNDISRVRVKQAKSAMCDLKFRNQCPRLQKAQGFMPQRMTGVFGWRPRKCAFLSGNGKSHLPRNMVVILST